MDAVDVVSEALSSPCAFAIAFSTYVDGERYVGSDTLVYGPAYGSSWVGHGRDKLVTICNPPEHSPPLVTPGKHTVQFRGSIPGSDVTLQSDVVEFELSNCENDGGDGSAPSGSGGIISGSGGHRRIGRERDLRRHHRLGWLEGGRRRITSDFGRAGGLVLVFAGVAVAVGKHGRAARIAALRDATSSSAEALIPSAPCASLWA